MTHDLPMRPAIARWTSASAKAAHCRLPPWKAREYVSVSNPSSVAVAFVAVPAAMVQPEGKPTETRCIGADSVGVCGPGAIDWLVVDRWSDTVEITGSPQLRRDIAAELGVEREADLGEVFGWRDPVIVAIARRLRAGLREWTYVSELEKDGLVRAAYGRTLIARFAGRDTGSAGALDHVRLQRVTEYAQANLERALSLADLAGVAALSPFHFARAFRAATGMTPHQFVTVGRLDRAAALLRTGGTRSGSGGRGVLQSSSFSAPVSRAVWHLTQAAEGLRTATQQDWIYSIAVAFCILRRERDRWGQHVTAPLDAT